MKIYIYTVAVATKICNISNIFWCIISATKLTILFPVCAVQPTLPSLQKASSLSSSLGWKISVSGVKAMDCRWKEEPSSVLINNIWSCSFMDEPTRITCKRHEQWRGKERKGRNQEVTGETVEYNPAIYLLLSLQSVGEMLSSYLSIFIHLLVLDNRWI